MNFITSMTHIIHLILLLFMSHTEKQVLTDFSRQNQGYWTIVNDGVMGGLSTSEVSFTSDNQMVFSGTVSLENNGGFASTRMKLKNKNLAGCSVISIRLKGDGKKYKFRVRTDDQWDGIAYSINFPTTKDTWSEIDFPLKDFRPTYRGREMPQAKELKVEDIYQIGLLISEKQEGSFMIVLDWIKCY
jgi:hypothetical protein